MEELQAPLHLRNRIHEIPAKEEREMKNSLRRAVRASLPFLCRQISSIGGSNAQVV